MWNAWKLPSKCYTTITISWCQHVRMTSRFVVIGHQTIWIIPYTSVFHALLMCMMELTHQLCSDIPLELSYHNFLGFYIMCLGKIGTNCDWNKSSNFDSSSFVLETWVADHGWLNNGCIHLIGLVLRFWFLNYSCQNASQVLTLYSLFTFLLFYSLDIITNWSHFLLCLLVSLVFLHGQYAIRFTVASWRHTTTFESFSNPKIL